MTQSNVLISHSGAALEEAADAATGGMLLLQ